MEGEIFKPEDIDLTREEVIKEALGEVYDLAVAYSNVFNTNYGKVVLKDLTENFCKNPLTVKEAPIDVNRILIANSTALVVEYIKLWLDKLESFRKDDGIY